MDFNDNKIVLNEEIKRAEQNFKEQRNKMEEFLKSGEFTKDGKIDIDRYSEMCSEVKASEVNYLKELFKNYGIDEDEVYKYLSGCSICASCKECIEKDCGGY